jgi:hypothetical protein
MIKSLKYKITIGLFIGSNLLINVNAQFAPAAGQIGTTAIHKDSSIFTNWAKSCIYSLGSVDISDSNNTFPTVGDSLSPTGKAGENGILSLGDGGSATLHFTPSISNNNGWDFCVFENSFSDYFLELAHVEVSSNGFDFYRFPSTSLTQDTTQIDAFGIINPEHINNLAGKYRVNFGTPFDLEEMTNIIGLDVNNITHVKIIDVIGNINPTFCNYDYLNNKINDPWPTPFPSSGFDLDGIGVINQQSLDIKILKNIYNISYTNPFSESIELLFESNINELTRIKLFNSNGAIIKELNHFSIIGLNSINISTNNLPKGFYIINIENDNCYTKLKLIKL